MNVGNAQYCELANFHAPALGCEHVYKWSLIVNRVMDIVHLHM